ncbi:hypothetical protein BDN70DRAFT_875700 [Pholiota conissans]|uniref:Uncharacterized protein n=1 Tax=Pholiota conissans TaxID=109636 RepID=A0A9P5Z827_9AGAR|nr:hypothetical protein BDN70DRAFT_875700 [Pholiota conissans]
MWVCVRLPSDDGISYVIRVAIFRNLHLPSPLLASMIRHHPSSNTAPNHDFSCRTMVDPYSSPYDYGGRGEDTTFFGKLTDVSHTNVDGGRRAWITSIIWGPGIDSATSVGADANPPRRL